MTKNKIIPVVIFLIILGVILYIHFQLPTPLFSPDGKDHWYFSTFQNCNSTYPSVACWLTKPLMFSQWAFWGFFFIISAIIIPLLFYRYTKNLWILPTYFIFSGFFWNSMAMQVFAQILLSIFLVFFIYEKDWRLRALILGSLILTSLYGFTIHNTEQYFIIATIGIEIIMLLSKPMKKLFAASFGILSSDIINKISTFSSQIRHNALYDGINLGSLFYYLYHFFFTDMFLGFMIPGIYHIIKSKDLRNFCYFLLVVAGAFITWYWQGWTIWGVTRVMLWIPLVLLIPFFNWIQKQTKRTKIIFYSVGILYFIFNLWYFYIRVQEMAYGY